MKRHILKTDPLPFDVVARGEKTFEIRFDDRDFAVGDELVLRRTESTEAEMSYGAPLVYSGRQIVVTVTHKLVGYGLRDGWCVLSIVGFGRGWTEEATDAAE